ncbi:MAG: kelch repeat-containing protein [Putridiphycobacter sp.]
MNLFKLTLLLTVLPNLLWSQDTWEQKDSVNGPPRSNCTSFVLDGEGWVIGGLDQTEFKRKMYSYDIDQDDWDDELAIGGLNGSGLNRGGAISFASHGKGYVGLGQGNGVAFFNDLWAYDPETESWSQKSTFMGSARRNAVCFEIDHIAYVGTGQDENGFTKDFYKYDSETNTWTQVSDFGGSARKGAVGFAMGAQGYVGTGDNGILVNDFWQYEPSTDTWTEKAAFPGTARSGASGWGIFPSAFIACGYDNTFNFKKDVWEYNYYADVWTQRSNFDGPKRSYATAFVIDGIAYLGLGYNGDYLDDFWAYTPILGLNQNQADFDSFSVYPTPAHETVQIKLNQTLPTDFNIEIFNLSGQKINGINWMANQNTLTLMVGELEKGAYFFKLTSTQDKLNLSGKLILV